MNLTRTIVCSLALPFCLSASGQTPRWPGQTSRWSLTFNPFGLLEPKGTIGIGVGYAIDKRWEVWSETSLIRRICWGSSTSGIRQIAQLKYFVSHSRLANFFLSAEVRYKGYEFAGTSNFYNSTTQTGQNFSEDHHYRWWGTALQAGSRQFFGETGRFYLDVSIGIGYRHIVYDRVTGVPAGFKQQGGRLADMTLIPIYYPGSVRLVWMFGRRQHKNR